MNINFNLFKYFYVVGKNMSFSKAAEELMISQPSLSYSIKVLEGQLNNKLFERVDNKIRFTSYGEDLYNKIKNSIEALCEIGDNEDLLNGEIKIGTPILYSSECLPYYVNMINNLYPNIILNIVTRERDELIKELENDKLDMIILEDRLNADIFCSNYIRDNKNKILMCVGKKFENNYNDLVTLEDLKNKTIGLVSQNRFAKEFIRKYDNLKVQNYYSSSMVLNKIMTTDIIGLFPQIYVEKDELKDKIKVLNTDFDLPKFRMSLSYKKNKSNKKILAVSDVFINYDLSELIKNK